MSILPRKYPPRLLSPKLEVTGPLCLHFHTKCTLFADNDTLFTYVISVVKKVCGYRFTLGDKILGYIPSEPENAPSLTPPPEPVPVPVRSTVEERAIHMRVYTGCTQVRVPSALTIVKS